MNPNDIIRTTCTRCNGSGLAPVRVGPGRPKQKIPCAHCEQRGFFERSVVERCERMLVGEPAFGEPAFCARRDAPAMALAACDFVARNPWCKPYDAIQIQLQGAEFHTATHTRRKRLQQRAESAKIRGQQLGRIPTRRELLERLAESRGTTPMLMAIKGYRAGRFSRTVWGLLTPGERSVAVAKLGFNAVGHEAILGIKAAF